VSTPNDRLRQLPSVDALIAHAGALMAREGRDRTVAALRKALADARQAVRNGADVPAPEALIAQAGTALDARASVVDMPLINATGVIIHTNLGRAPVSAAAQQAMLAAAGGYSPIELDMSSGERGRRAALVEDLLCELTGAEAALVVNNCAAATVLMLAAHAAGKRVAIARGQLVEIGGGFRVPEIMVQSGAQLVEIGTTNRVKPADYARALREHVDLSAFLRVHSSNFKMIGFVEEVGVDALVQTAAERPGVVVLDDLGSGALIDTSRYGLPKEPMPQDSVAAGVHVTCFSGDKLLGGPQAGLLVGTRAAIDICRRHPFARAFRADKVTQAALGATLLHYARGEAEREIPVIRMMALTPAQIEARAQAVVSACADALMRNGITVTVIDATSTVGGGSLPGEILPTRAIALRSTSAEQLINVLRTLGVIARIHQDAVLLDLRTVLDDAALVQILQRMG
jgi:L-seryl-tRNA(Ser) seleniumtransferase